MGFREISVGVVLAGLFALALVTVSFSLSSNNGANYSIIDNQYYRSFNQSIQGNLSSTFSGANDQRTVFESQEAQGGSEGFSLTSIVSVVFKFISSMFGTLKSMTDAASGVLGIPAVALNVFLTTLTISIVLLAWRVFKAGTP